MNKLSHSFHCRQQDSIEGDKDRLLALANKAEQERLSQTGEVERLTKELMMADTFPASHLKSC